MRRGAHSARVALAETRSRRGHAASCDEASRASISSSAASGSAPAICRCSGARRTACASVSGWRSRRRSGAAARPSRSSPASGDSTRRRPKRRRKRPPWPVRAGDRRAERVRLRSELEGGPARSDELTLLPQRRWHSTSPTTPTSSSATPTRRRGAAPPPSLSRLDSIAATHEDFRWTVESNLPLERWLAVRPRQLREEFLGHLLSGRFEVCALPFTMHVEALSIDELTRTAQLCARPSAPSRRRGRDRGGTRPCPGRRPACRSCWPTPVSVISPSPTTGPRGDAAPDRRRGGEEGVQLGHGGGQAGARLAHRQPARHRVPGGQGTSSGSPIRMRPQSSPLPEYLAALALRGYPWLGQHETPGGATEPPRARRTPTFKLLHLARSGSARRQRRSKTWSRPQ